MNENLKLRLQQRMEMAEDLAARNRIDQFFKDFYLINEEDEYGTFGFVNRHSGASYNPFYSVPGTGEQFEDWLQQERSDFQQQDDLRSIAQFVKDWSRLDRSERLSVIRENMDAFDPNSGLWMAAMTDHECAQLKNANVEDIYMCLAGVESIEGVRGVMTAKMDLLHKHGLDTPSADRFEAAAPAMALKAA